MPVPTRPSTTPVVFGVNATRTAPTPEQQSNGYTAGIPVPPDGHNWLFHGLTEFWSATRSLLTENLWNFLGAPSFTGGAIARERSSACSTWTVRDATGTIVDQTNTIAVAGAGEQFTAKLDVNFLPDGATLTGFMLDFERDGDAGEGLSLSLTSIQNAGLQDEISGPDIGDAVNISGDLYRITVLGLSEVLALASKRYVFQAFVQNGAVPQGVRLLGLRVQYTVPNLESSL